MDRQFDFRALLLKIHDRLSKDDQHRLHFLVGDNIPRAQREDVTLAGTLTLFESLFDRALVNEDDLDFLIRLFSEIQCHDAVKRLQEYQVSKGLVKGLPKERQLIASDIFNDNLDEDKCSSTPYETLISKDSNNPPLFKPELSKKTTSEFIFTATEKPNTRKMTTTETLSMVSEPPDINNQPLPNITSTQKQKTSFKLRLIHTLYILFFLQILALLIYLWIFMHKKIPDTIIENRYQRNVYILKYGSFSDGIEGKWFDQSKDLLLTYNDQLLEIEAYVDMDKIYSIKFIYSQNKSKKYELRNLPKFLQTTLISINFKEQNLQDISHCYKNNTRSQHLVGIRFGKLSRLIGTCYDQIMLEDKYSNHIFGYALGKQTQYLNGFQFIWYKLCSYHNRVTLCS